MDVVIALATIVLLWLILLRIAWWAARGSQVRQLVCFLLSWFFGTIIGAVVYTVALVIFKRRYAASSNLTTGEG